MKSIYQIFWGYGNDPLRVFDYYFKHGSWAGDGSLEALILVFLLAIICACIFYRLSQTAKIRENTQLLVLFFSDSRPGKNPYTGLIASSGIMQVVPCVTTPGIRFFLQWFCTCLCVMPHFSAASFVVMQPFMESPL